MSGYTIVVDPRISITPNSQVLVFGTDTANAVNYVYQCLRQGYGRWDAKSNATATHSSEHSGIFFAAATNGLEADDSNAFTDLLFSPDQIEDEDKRLELVHKFVLNPSTLQKVMSVLSTLRPPDGVKPYIWIDMEVDSAFVLMVPPTPAPAPVDPDLATLAKLGDWNAPIRISDERFGIDTRCQLLVVDSSPYRSSTLLGAIHQRLKDTHNVCNKREISQRDNSKRTLITRDIKTSEPITLEAGDMASIMTFASRLADVRDYEAKKFDVVILHESELATQAKVINVLEKFRNMSPKQMYDALERLKKARYDDSEMYLMIGIDLEEWRWIASPKY